MSKCYLKERTIRLFATVVNNNWMTWDGLLCMRYTLLTLHIRPFCLFATRLAREEQNLVVIFIVASMANPRADDPADSSTKIIQRIAEYCQTVRHDANIRLANLTGTTFDAVPAPFTTHSASLEEMTVSARDPLLDIYAKGVRNKRLASFRDSERDYSAFGRRSEEISVSMLWVAVKHYVQFLTVSDFQGQKRDCLSLLIDVGEYIATILTTWQWFGNSEFWWSTGHVPISCPFAQCPLSDK
jgi:hypothetical protein